MPYGLLTTGFVPQTLEVVRDEIETELRDAFGNSIDLSDESVLGQLVGIVAERFALLWEVAEAVNASQDPDAATGAGLDALCALTGTIREPARPSEVTSPLTGTPATLVSSGSRAKTTSTAKSFATLADATIAALTAWATGTAYVVGDRRYHTNAGTSRAYECITAGTSHGTTGPTSEAADVTDNTAHWTYLGRGTGAVDADAEATADGPTVAVARDVTTIETPVGGWSSVINLLDADVGADVESDAVLRMRREDELVAAGNPTADGIREKVLALDDVETCTVFVNNTDVTDADGVPPHAVEVLVRGGADQDIFDALLASVAVGIATHGTEVGSALDSEGTSHVVKFSRPTEVTIYVDITYVYDPDEFPADGDDQVKAAIVAFGDLSATGKDAVAVSLGAQAFKVAGVLNVPRSGSLGGTLIKTSAGPTSDATITITSRQLATYDTSRITTHSSTGTP